VADAIDLCGSVAKLQAANVQYMGEVKSLVVDGKTEKKITYPELTPDLRASAIRSISHCINLRLGKITPESYDKLMTLEATNAAAAERALTSDQLEDLVAKGYKKVADILREAGVSSSAIAQVATVSKAELSGSSEPDVSKASPEMQALTDINAKMGTLETALKGVPGEIVKAMSGAPKPPVTRQAKPLVKVLFSSRAATLDSVALLALYKTLPEIEPDAQLSVVGSADANGDEMKNLELSRQRAQSVAVWLMVNRRIEPQRIHVAARGAEKGVAISPDDRSVTVFGY
jgi:outer membrane protein OmpA-like peptidoglycan-associated protein